MVREPEKVVRPNGEGIRSHRSSTEIMPRCLHNKTHVVLTRKVHAGLDVLRLSGVDDIDRITETAAWCVRGREASVIIPIIVGTAHRIILMESPGGCPEACNGGTGGIAVV